MSRIAGIHTPSQGRPLGPLIDDLVRPLSGAGGETHRVLAEGAALAWHGRGEARAAEEGGRIAVVDGLVYNADELGGAADARLLLRLHEKLGFAGALQRLNGDFAAALYDPASRTLWLGRDRFGLKPLYYHRSAEHVAFASRPASLLALPGVDRRPDPRFVAIYAASHYRYFDNDPARSPYLAIDQLPAGHVLQVGPGGVRSYPYWSLTDAPDVEGDEETLAERYRALLLDSVSVRLRRSPRPAFTLSGGMDSSSVLACAVHLAGQRQHAFSAVYTDETYDESQDIASMLETTVERWHPVAVGDPDVFALVEQMVAANDEPVATATWLAHFLLCQQAAHEGFGALFGGLGGDELNAGEYEHYLYHFADLRAEGREEALGREVAAWARHHDHPVYRKSAATMEEGLRRLVDMRTPGRCLVDRTRLLRYAAALDPGYFDLAGFEPVMEHPFRSYLKNRTFQDLTRETIPCCLRAEERQTTAFGLERFLPFLDHRLVEYMFRVPGSLKIRDGVSKHLLRRATRGLLPEATRTRIKKTGWNAPAHRWFMGAGKDRLLDLVRSRAFRERGIYVAREVERIVEEHDRIVSSGEVRENHMMFLWQVLNLETWLR